MQSTFLHALARPARRAACLIALLVAGFAVPAGAAIRIDVEGVDGEVRGNVYAFLTIERFRYREDLQEDAVLRMYNRIDGEARSALRPFGFYSPQVRTTLEPQDEGRNWRVLIQIDAGPPVIIESVEVAVTGAGAENPLFGNLLNQSVLRKGDPLHHRLYEQVKGDLQRTAAANGYLDAKLTENQMLVDTAARTAQLRLTLETGERYHFGAVSIEQSVIRPELMRRFLRFREGDPYSTTELLRTQFALDDSLYFATVEVLPVDRDREALSVPIRITAMPSRRAFSFGPGYGTDTGVRGTLSFTDSRLNTRGHRLFVEVRASAISRTFDTRYDMPMGDPALEKFSLQLVRREEEISVLDTTEISFTPSLTRVLGRWQRVTSLSLTHTTTDDGASRISSSLLVPSISYASVPEGFLGEALFSRGLYFDVIGSQSLLGSRADFVRAHLQFERVFDLVPQWHLLLRGEAGSSLVKDFNELPGIYRFFAGGDRSVRGFGYNALSPTQRLDLRGCNRQPQSPGAALCGVDRPTGGRHLAFGSIELARDLPRNFAVATFVDVGNAFNSFGDPMEYSAGVGLRYRLPVVTLGIDVAQPLSVSGSPRLHLNISPKL
jgi:translocation and assembly module TamA